MSKKKWSIVIVGIAVIALSAGLMNGLILNTSSTADLDDSEFEEPVIGDKEVISNGTHRLIYKRIKLSNTVYKRYQNGTVIMVITNTRDLGFPDLVGISDGTGDGSGDNLRDNGIKVDILSSFDSEGTNFEKVNLFFLCSQKKVFIWNETAVY